MTTVKLPKASKNRLAAKNGDGQADFQVKDIGLADWGRKTIQVAEQEMPGHFLFGDLDGLATPVGQTDVLDLEVSLAVAVLGGQTVLRSFGKFDGSHAVELFNRLQDAIRSPGSFHRPLQRRGFVGAFPGNGLEVVHFPEVT